MNLLQQEIVSGSGISWAICKSAPRYRQVTMPASQHSVFTGWMPFLLPNQQDCHSQNIINKVMLTAVRHFHIIHTSINAFLQYMSPTCTCHNTVANIELQHTITNYTMPELKQQKNSNPFKYNITQQKCMLFNYTITGSYRSKRQ